MDLKLLIYLVQPIVVVATIFLSDVQIYIYEHICFSFSFLLFNMQMWQSICLIHLRPNRQLECQVQTVFINQLATRGRVLHLKGLGSVVIALKTEQIKYFVPVIYLESRDSNFVTIPQHFLVLIFLRNKHTQGRIGIGYKPSALLSFSLSNQFIS